MILLGFEGTAATKPQIAIVFGSGLIGSSVVGVLRRSGRLLYEQALAWSWPTPTNVQRCAVETAVKRGLERQPSAHVTTIWAAGRSGFGSSQEEMSSEYQAFLGVKTLARQLASSSGQASYGFMHISSAGGLFEGQVACDKDAVPRPIRAYGHGKLQQEAALSEETDLGRRLIMRPSSVFGYVAHGRLGLISALISAAIRHREAVIFGAFHTQRDFIFAPDIGRYIAQKLFSSPDQAEALETAIIASGRPASVFEIIKTVEEVAATPLYLKIDAEPGNALNNTFRASALPLGFIPTPLRQGIQHTKSAMEKHSFGI